MGEFKNWLGSFAGTGLDWVGTICIVTTVVLAILKVTGTIGISYWWVFSPLGLLGVVIFAIYVWMLIEVLRDEL